MCVMKTILLLKHYLLTNVLNGSLNVSKRKKTKTQIMDKFQSTWPLILHFIE